MRWNGWVGGVGGNGNYFERIATLWRILPTKIFKTFSWVEISRCAECGNIKQFDT